SGFVGLNGVRAILVHLVHEQTRRLRTVDPEQSETASRFRALRRISGREEGGRREARRAEAGPGFRREGTRMWLMARVTSFILCGASRGARVVPTKPLNRDIREPGGSILRIEDTHRVRHAGERIAGSTSPLGAGRQSAGLD